MLLISQKRRYFELPLNGDKIGIDIGQKNKML